MAHGGEDPNGAKRTDLYRTIRSFCISAAHNFMTVDVSAPKLQHFVYAQISAKLVLQSGRATIC